MYAYKNYTDNSGSFGLKDGMFSFSLKPVGNNANTAPMPEGSTGTGSDRTASFINYGTEIILGQMTYTQEMAGNTYTYEISENIPTGAVDNGNGTFTLGQMTYDGTKYQVHVSVSLDGDKVVAVPDYSSTTGYPEFKNVYTPSDVVLEADTALAGEKTLTGRDMKAGESFKFTIEAADNITKQAITDGIVILSDTEASVSGGKDGEAVSFDFGKTTFKKAGVYSFEVKENAGNAGGVTYDSHTCYITVTVVSENGVLSATTTYNNGAGTEDNSKAVFENTYVADKFEGMPINLNGTKHFTGQSLEANEFFFTIEAVDDAPLGDTVTMVPNAAGTDTDGDGTYSGNIELLKNITYTKAGVYTYIIKENVPTEQRKGVSYDVTEYTVSINVTDNGEGKLVASAPVITTAGGTADSVDFTNTYVPEKAIYVPYSFTKVLEGNRPKALEANEFYFIKALDKVNSTNTDGIRFVDDDDNDGVVRVGNLADGTIQFGNVEFTKPGTYIVTIREEIPDSIPAGMVYDTHVVTSTFVVSDDQNGNLNVIRTDSVYGRQFVNKY